MNALKLKNLLDIEVLQHHSQTLTRALDREFAGTVHLIKRETCGSCFGNFKPGTKHQHDFVSAEFPHGWNRRCLKYLYSHREAHRCCP